MSSPPMKADVHVIWIISDSSLLYTGDPPRLSLNGGNGQIAGKPSYAARKTAERHERCKASWNVYEALLKPAAS